MDKLDVLAQQMCAYPHMSVNEIECLMYYASHANAHLRTLVNVGAGNGVSGLALRISMRSRNLLITVDQNFYEHPDGSIQAEIDALVRAGVYDEEHYFYEIGDSISVGRKWSHGLIGLLLLDAHTTYEGVMEEIEVWLPHIARGGLVIVHDDQPPAAQRAAEDMIGDDQDYRFLTQTDNLIVYRYREVYYSWIKAQKEREKHAT